MTHDEPELDPERGAAGPRAARRPGLRAASEHRAAPTSPTGSTRRWPRLVAEREAARLTTEHTATGRVVPMRPSWMPRVAAAAAVLVVLGFGGVIAASVGHHGPTARSTGSAARGQRVGVHPEQSQLQRHRASKGPRPPGCRGSTHVPGSRSDVSSRRSSARPPGRAPGPARPSAGADASTPSRLATGAASRVPGPARHGRRPGQRRDPGRRAGRPRRPSPEGRRPPRRGLELRRRPPIGQHHRRSVRLGR